VASFVMDCSITMAWCFSDEATSATDHLLARMVNERAVVPYIWLLEVTNVLVHAEQRGRISINESKKFIAILEELEIEIDQALPARIFHEIPALARASRITTYDAAYLELALTRQLPLATLDQPLRKVAKKLGVQLLGI